LSSANTVHDHALKLLVDRRAELASKTAMTSLELDACLLSADWRGLRRRAAELQQTLRSQLAFLNGDIYAQLERLRLLCPRNTADRDAALADPEDFADQLKLLQVSLARAIFEAQPEPLEDILGLPVRLRRKLEQSEAAKAARLAQRATEERAWGLEADARRAIAAGQFPKALKALTQAVELHELPVFHNDMGYAYGQGGEVDEAVRSYRRAAALNESRPELRSEEYQTTYFNLGVALRKLAQQHLLEDRLELALKANRDARDALARYRALLPHGPQVGRAASLIVRVSKDIDELIAMRRVNTEVA
jgi:tetratricopeptide (TPR) repeat protein